MAEPMTLEGAAKAVAARLEAAVDRLERTMQAAATRIRDLEAELEAARLGQGGPPVSGHC